MMLESVDRDFSIKLKITKIITLEFFMKSPTRKLTANYSVATQKQKLFILKKRRIKSDENDSQTGFLFSYANFFFSLSHT